MAEHGRKIHITETPDASHIKNIDVTHEKSDVQVGGIAKFIVGLLVLTIATFIGLWGMFLAFQKGATQKEQEVHRSPIAMTGEERLPPEPRLQSAPGFGEALEKQAAVAETPESAKSPGAKPSPTPKDPLWEINALRGRWNDVLEHGPVDEHGQRYGMPIERAKEEVLKQFGEKQKAVSSKQ